MCNFSMLNKNASNIYMLTKSSEIIPFIVFELIPYISEPYNNTCNNNNNPLYHKNYLLKQ